MGACELPNGVEGLTLALFTRVLEWSAEKTMALCGRVRKNFKDLGLHGIGTSEYSCPPPLGGGGGCRLGSQS